MAHDPLPLLLSSYERYGPIFSLRLFYARIVFMLGPEANHYVTVSHPENFHWREGSFGDLIPLLGDGLLTIDGDYHDRARRIMMPAFHREQIEAAVEAMARRGRGRARRRCGRARSSTSTTGCATWRCGSRCGRCSASTPTTAGTARRPPSTSSARSRFYGTDYHLRLRRGRGSPWRRMMTLARGARRDRLRRDRPAPRAARPRAPRHPQPPARAPGRGRLAALRRGGPRPGDDPDVRRPRHLDLDPLVPALRARPQPARARARCRTSRTRCWAASRRRRSSSSASCPTSRWSLDEMLRLYPPAWIGPRRAVRDFEFAGCDGPGRRLRQLLLLGQPPPARGLPRARGVHPRALRARAQGGAARAAPTSRSAAARGSASASASARPRSSWWRRCCSSGCGSSCCPGRTMTIRQMPTLSPEGGLAMRVRERELPEPLGVAGESAIGTRTPRRRRGVGALPGRVGEAVRIPNFAFGGLRGRRSAGFGCVYAPNLATVGRVGRDANAGGRPPPSRASARTRPPTQPTRLCAPPSLRVRREIHATAPCYRYLPILELSTQQ